jgi:hypothetical protein
MPHPGQRAGSLDASTGDNISNYLNDYNAECELYVIRPEHRTILFPHFCIPKIKEIVTFLPGYKSPRDWDLLQSEIKRFYWSSDHPKNSLAALNTLICSSNSIPLRVFILKFCTITDVLVSKGLLSLVD